MPSSFFPDRLDGSSGVSASVRSVRRGPGLEIAAERIRTEQLNAVEEILQREALVQSARDLRLVAPFALAETPPPWDRANFVPSDITRIAFEKSHEAEQFELRAREGLGTSVRFPATRTALWHPEAQGLPVHVTHDSCLPSVSLPPSVLESLRSVLEDAVDEEQLLASLELELVGNVTSVDHQLAYSQSVTRGRLQVVFDAVRQRSAKFCGDGDVRAALLLRQYGAADAEIISSEEQQEAVTAISHILKERQHLASALDYLQLSVLCVKSNGRTLTLLCQATLPCVSFMLTPLRLLKVIPTSLSQALYERLSADAHPATGFLSMDQSRRLLLIPQLDPKARQVPLVGVWISGVDSLADSFVWGALARYLHCTEIGEKVTCHDGAFLCLFYHRTALRQPPALLQVRVHSGQAMFAHLSSSPLVLPLTRGSAMDTADKISGLLEFDQRRVHYSYAADYDILRETLSSPRSMPRDDSTSAPQLGRSDGSLAAAPTAGNSGHVVFGDRFAEASMDLPRTAVPQPSPQPPAAPHSYSEGSTYSGQSASADTSCHSLLLSQPQTFAEPFLSAAANLSPFKPELHHEKTSALGRGDEIVSGAHARRDAAGLSTQMFAEYLEPLSPSAAETGGNRRVANGNTSAANFMLAATVRNVPLSRRKGEAGNGLGGSVGEFGGDGGLRTASSGLSKSSGAARRRVDMDCDVCVGRADVSECSVVGEQAACASKEDRLQQQIAQQQQQIAALAKLVQALQSRLPEGHDSSMPRSGISPCKATSTAGTQLSPDINKSLLDTAVSLAHARALPACSQSARPQAALLLPESPAAPARDEKLAAGGWSGEHQEDGTDESRHVDGVGGYGSTCVVARNVGGREGGMHVGEQDIRVFADTLGMQGGASTVSEVLRSTFPQPRTALAPIMTAMDVCVNLEARISRASPSKTGSPEKAQKVFGAEQAHADPGIASSDSPASDFELQCATSDTKAATRAVSSALPNSARRRSGRRGDDEEKVRSFSASARDEDMDWDDVSRSARGEGDRGGTGVIDYVNCSIVRAKISDDCVLEEDSEDDAYVITEQRDREPELIGVYSTSDSSEEDNCGKEELGGPRKTTSRGGEWDDDVDLKYLSASLLARIESGDDVMINGRRLL